MKLREKIKVVSFPVFDNYEITVVVTDNVKLSRNSRSAAIGANLDKEMYGCHSSVSNGKAFIFLERGVSPGIVAHECWHGVKRMLESKGAILENEVVAYHLEYLVDQISKLV
jgi:hypothetical protein